MIQYLTPRQRKLFLSKLTDTSPEQSTLLTADEQANALRQGAQMAQSDMQNAPLSEEEEAALFDGEVPEEENDPAAERLNALGFQTGDELMDAYEHLSRRYADLMADIRRAEAMNRARKNARLLESDPSGRNRLIQSEWIRRADELADLTQFLPDMAEYITAHPEYAVESDGLERAYDAVRSRLYRSEEELLGDPNAVKRLSADSRIREAVLTSHLAGIYKNGAALPAFIGEEGSTPGSAPAKSGMDKAKFKLLAMLRE